MVCLGDQSGSSTLTVLSQDSSMYIFDSHSRDGSGMTSANGTAVLMQFDNIQTTVSFICELADSLAARLFHWTFWHSVPTTSCDCDTYLGKSIPAIVDSYKCLWAFIGCYTRFSGLQSSLGITNGNRSHNKPLELIETI